MSIIRSREDSATIAAQIAYDQARKDGATESEAAGRASNAAVAGGGLAAAVSSGFTSLGPGTSYNLDLTRNYRGPDSLKDAQLSRGRFAGQVPAGEFTSITLTSKYSGTSYKAPINEDGTFLMTNFTATNGNAYEIRMDGPQGAISADFEMHPFGGAMTLKEMGVAFARVTDASTRALISGPAAKPVQSDAPTFSLIALRTKT